MFKKIVIVIFVLALAMVSKGNAGGSWNGWIYQDPYPTSNTLLAVKFVTPKKGWVAGEVGTILYTEDGGDTWEVQESGTEQPLSSITFINEKSGWAVGEYGIIIHTANGGKTWVTQENIESRLLKIYFINDQEGWVVGSEGTMLHTSNGGKKWVRKDVGIKRSISSVYFINAQNGWIQAGGEVYRTTNGGGTWERSVFPRDEYPVFGAPGHGEIVGSAGEREDLFFVDDKKGWAVVGFSLIFHTKDGGRTWTNQLHTGRALSYGLSRISFSDAQNGCAAGSSILCTADGGKTWNEKLGVPAGSGKRINHFEVQFQGISFPGQSIGWAVGNDGFLMKSEDGGRSWKLAARRDECGQDVYFVNNKTGWFYNTTDYTTYICRTDDGGHTRQKQEVGLWVWGMFFTDASTGWSMGTIEDRNQRDRIENVYGVIKHTTDGGKTWTTQYKELMGTSRFGTGLLGIFFINNDIGWISARNGTVLHTEDGGMHWERQKIGSSFEDQLIGIQFINPKVGWIAGIGGNEEWMGIVLQTVDGGKHWEKQYSIKDVGLTGIFFMDEKIGWLTGLSEDGGSGWLLHTADGGAKWMKEEFGDIGYSNPAFLDKQRGAISTKKGLIILTTNGGQTWQKIRKPIRKYPWHFSEMFEDDGKLK